MEVGRQRTFEEVARWSAAVLTAGASAIHFSVMPEHFAEDWTFGIFFACAAWSQLAFATLVVGSEDRRLPSAGVGGNVAIALVWAASRSTGLPFGPEPGARETIGLLDVTATAFELLAAASLVLALRSHGNPVSARRVFTFIGALALVVITLTTAAIAAGTDHR